MLAVRYAKRELDRIGAVKSVTAERRIIKSGAGVYSADILRLHGRFGEATISGVSWGCPGDSTTATKLILELCGAGADESRDLAFHSQYPVGPPRQKTYWEWRR